MTRTKDTLSVTFVMVAAMTLVAGTLACSAGSLGSGGAAQTAAPAETESVVATQVIGAQPTAADQPTAGPKSDRGTVDEARAMLQKAVEHYQSVGRDQALKDFSSRVPPFFDRDLYVVCLTADHIETANGGFPQYVGTSADQLKDVNGTPVGKMIWDAGAASSESTKYQWVNPATGKTEWKVLYLANLGTDVCGVGVYSDQ